MRLLPLALLWFAASFLSLNAQNKKQEYSIHNLENAPNKEQGYWVVDPDEKKDEPQKDSLKVIVRLKTEGSGNGRMKSSTVEDEHKKFLKDLSKLGKSSGSARTNASTIIRYEYKQAFNGFALTTTQNVVQEIKKLPYVFSVSEDKIVKVFDVTSNEIIKAPQVWADFGVTGNGIKIGIIDTGIDYSHSDLGGGFGDNFKVAGGYDFVNNDNDPMDDHGHGTHVAGIAAANGTSLKGVAPNATLYAYKVLNSDGFGNDSQILAAIERAVDPDQNPDTDDALDVVNMSLGRYADPNEPLSVAVNNAVAKGVIFVVAAGNSYNFLTIGTPGVAKDAITVAATDQYNNTAYFSSKGPVERTFDSKPDIAAPGVDIYSCFLNQQYKTESGTSMASPHVAGAAALLLEKFPNWTPQMVKSALMGSANKTVESLWEQGAGVMNIYDAIQKGFLMEPGAISFGLIDKTQTVLSTKKTVTIHNTGDVSKSFSMGTNGFDNPAINISFNPSSFTIDVNNSQEVEVSFEINVSLLEVLNLPAAHFGEIVATSDGTSVKTVFSIVNPRTTKINFTGEVPHTVIVIGIEGSTFWQPYYPNGQSTLELFLPKAKYDFLTQYYNNYTVISQDINTENDVSLDIDKALAKNTIVFEPLDKEGNPISFTSNISGIAMFSGLNRNILTFYPYAEDTFHISDQDHYKFDMKIHGRPNPESEYYDISASTPHGIKESKNYSNDYQNFTTITFDNPSITNQDDQQMVYYTQAGHPWIYFSTWNTYPYVVTNPLTIYHSQNSHSSLLMGNLVQFSALPEKPGYRWETARWNVTKGDSISFLKPTGENITTIISNDFKYDLGKSLLMYNLYSSNEDSDEGSIQLTDEPGRGAFNRHYGERERGTILYKLYSGETIIKEGAFQNRFNDDYGVLLDENVPQQAYKLVLNYEDYQVGGKFGKAEVTLEFNTSGTDKNSPGLSLLSLEADGLSINEITPGQSALLKFKINDQCQDGNLFNYPCNSSGIQSTVAKIKNIDSEEWTELSLENPEAEEFSAVIPSDLTSGYYSLLLISSDNDNNKFTYELNPAFLVGAPTASIPYAVVTLVSPKNRDINAGSNPEFKWNPIDGAIGYTIQISKNQNFVELAIDTNVGLTTTYSLPSPLPDESNYYWRVKANFEGSAIPWSETYTFFSGKLPQAQLLEPLNNSTDNPLNIKFKWERPSDSFWQTFEISKTEDFSYVVYYSGSTGDTTTVSNLAPGTEYYWRVTSLFSTFYDTYYIQSEVFKFKTSELSAATLAEPQNNTSNHPLSIKFKWIATAGLNTPKFELSRSIDFSSIVYATEVSSDSVIVNNLVAGTNYYWRLTSGVQSIEGYHNVFSDIFQFRTIEMASSTLLEPGNSSSGHPLTIKFKWVPHTNSAEEKFEISEENDFSPLVFAATLDDDTITVTNLLPQTKYYWRVKSTFVSGDKSYYKTSNTFYFKTFELPHATLLEPLHNTTGLPLNIKFKWTSPPNSLRQQLELSNSSDFSSIVFQADVAEDTVTAHHLLPDTDYYWRIRSAFTINDNTYYKFSSTFHFKTFELRAATLLQPLNNATDQPLSLKFKWNTPPNSLQQQLELSNSADFSTIVFHSVADDESITINNLLPGIDYYWRVGTTFQDSYHTLSEAFHFKTLELPTSIVTEASKFFLNYYPNPFRDKINISFFSKNSGEMELVIRDAVGREVRRFAEMIDHGDKILIWDAKNTRNDQVPDGIYIGELRINSETIYFRIVLKK